MAKRDCIWIAVVTCVLTCAFATSAVAQVPLFGEDFNDETLAAGAVVSAQGVIAGGVVTFNDTEGGNKSRLSVAQSFTDPVMTFSFDMVDPVTPGPNGEFNDFLLRAADGTGADVPGSGDTIFEIILHRDAGNRGTYTNNGNESVFIVVNNQDAPLTFTSPITSLDVSIDPFRYITYLRNNDTTTFTEMKGTTAMGDQNGVDPGVGVITRFAIGNSANAKLGGFAFDNVLVMSGATFTQVIPPQGLPGDVDGDEDVDMDDFAIIQSHFQQTVATREEGDLTFDDFVDFRDFRQWKTNAPAEVLAEWAALGVPEPSTAVMAGLSLAAGVAARRRRKK
jgi:hypothetical protein